MELTKMKECFVKLIKLRKDDYDNDAEPEPVSSQNIHPRKRKLSRLQVDQTTQLPRITMAQVADYGDLLRVREPLEEIPDCPIAQAGL